MPNPNHDPHTGRFSTGETSASIDRYPVASHRGVQSVGTHNAGKKAIGTHYAGPGFTINKRTGKEPTSGFAVGGAPSSAKYIGGGGGWPTEHVTVAREGTLGRSLARKYKQASGEPQEAIYDLGRKQTIATGRPRRSRAA
jgi:hypothetical protein